MSEFAITYRDAYDNIRQVIYDAESEGEAVEKFENGPGAEDFCEIMDVVEI